MPHFHWTGSIAGLAGQEAGRFDGDGQWVATHFLGGSVVRPQFGEHAVNA